MTTHQIKVFDITGKYAADRDTGQSLFTQIDAALKAGDSVALDFGGVEIYTAAFFNYAIAQLLRDFTPDHLNSHLTLIHLPPYAHTIVETVIDNAKQFYGQNRDKFGSTN